MTTFKDAYTQVNKLLKEWGEGGIDLAGETEKEWIFKGHVVKEDDLSGSCIIVEKDNGDMRLYNAGRSEDREVTYHAKQIDIGSMLQTDN